MRLRLSRKLVMPAVFCTAFLLGYYMATYQFSLLRAAEEFSLSNAQTGVLAGAYFFALLFVPVTFGILSDRRGKKPFLIIACALLLTAVALFANAKSYPAVLAAALVGSGGFGSLEGLYLSLVADVYPKKITLLNNLAASVFSVGAFLGPLIASDLIGVGVAWRYIFLPVAFVLCAVIVLFFFMAAGGKPTPPKKNALSPGRASLLKQPLFYMLLLWIMMYLGVESSTASFADMYIGRDLGAPQISALAISLFWVVMIPSRLIAGLLKKNHMRLMILCCAFLAVSSALAASLKNPFAAFACVAASGFFCGPLWPTIFAYNQQAFPHATGTVGTSNMALSGLGGFLFPMFFGRLSEGGTFSAAYYAMAVLAAAMVVMAFFVNRSLKTR